jgi:hypothetical protein
MDPSDERWDIDFSVCKSLRYHAYRRAFWDTLSNFSKILTIISGTAVLVTIVGEYRAWATGLSIVVAFTSAADLVLGFSEKARTHNSLYREFSILAQNIIETPQPDQQMLSKWKRRRLEIEMEEPTAIDLLERRCYAEEAIARGCNLEATRKLKWWQITLSQVWFLPTIPVSPPNPP